MNNIVPELNQVFREVFNDPSINITETTTSNDVEGWDSFSYINLLSAIELHFNIEFSQSEAMSFSNVGELINIVNKKLNNVPLK
jgi:acyl carrier protein